MNTEQTSPSSSSAPTGEGAQAGGAPAGADSPAASTGAAAPSFSDPRAAAPQEPVSAAERALRKAEQRLKPQDSEASEQAGQKQADSTQGAKPTGQDGAATSGQDKPAASTAYKAPDAWPEPWRRGFDALPNEGRNILLDVHKSMQSGFTKAMQALGDKGRLAEEYAGHQETFARDPKAFLRALAADAKLEIRFADEPGPDEVPEFKDAADMARWVAEQTRRQVEARMRAERGAEERQRAGQSAREQVQAELDQAERAHPDFAEHRRAVFDVLDGHPGIPVEDAYRIATYDRLAEQVNRANAELAELRKFKAQAEKSAKRLTTPIGGAGSGNPDPSKNPHLSPAERAFNRAQARLAARG